MRRKLLTLWLMLALCVLLPINLAADTVRGLASWYGKNHQGKRMANGERFDRHHLTAASRTIPLGRRVRVTYLRTMKQIEVTITDRGPASKKRVLDLSEAAAVALGLKPYGIGKVKIEDIPDRPRL